jgi:CRISPR-associated endonuclease/helicase Cas3
VNIPADNRCLVEAATHSDRLRAIHKELGPPWQQLGQQVEGDTGAERTIADLQALDVDTEFGMLPFPDDVRIATRLGVQDRLIRFEPPLPGPFGEPLKQLPIRHFLLPAGLDPDLAPSAIAQESGVVEFKLGETHFRYSRFGLEQLKND